MSNFNKSTFLRRLGGWIERLRKFRKVSQDELTRKSGLSSGAISRIENGMVDPQVTTLVKVARALNVSPATILDVDGEMKIAQRI